VQVARYLWRYWKHKHISLVNNNIIILPYRYYNNYVIITTILRYLYVGLSRQKQNQLGRVFNLFFTYIFRLTIEILLIYNGNCVNTTFTRIWTLWNVVIDPVSNNIDIAIIYHWTDENNNTRGVKKTKTTA